jgi:hypothetical protein
MIVIIKDAISAFFCGYWEIGMIIAGDTAAIRTRYLSIKSNIAKDN